MKTCQFGNNVFYFELPITSKMPAECHVNTINEGGSFWDEAIGIILFLMFHFLLLIQTLHTEIKNRNDVKFQNQKRIRIWYIIIQIVAVYHLINEFFKLIDSFTFIVRHNAMCTIIPYTTKTIPVVFYCLYLHLILLRLRISFDGSHLALSTWTVLIYQTLIILLPSIVCILILIDSAGDSVQCLRSWYPVDVSFKLTYCDIPWDSLTLFKEYGFYAVVALANLLNISFGIVFTIKLKQISSLNSNEKIGRGFQELIRKNTILTVIGICTSLAGYLIYAATELVFFVYLDGFINCCIVGLMLKYNEWDYQRLCCLCIACCYRKEKVLEMIQLQVNSPTSMNPDENAAENPSKFQTQRASHIEIESFDDNECNVITS